ncbi:MAG: hypothetical protein HGA65_19985, partial [Oscillochloris sp.]|nr:hypothetical protein [Oscillochloris sp.]
MRVAGAIFCILLGLYLLTTGGHFYAFDEERMYDLTEAIGVRGVLYLNAPDSDQPPVYSSYGPGQSIAGLPLFLLGEVIAQGVPEDLRPWITRAVVGWFNPLITAFLAALVYLASRRITPHWPALLAALAYGLGSTAWPHTKTFFAEPLTALLWFMAFLLVWHPTGPAPTGPAIILAGFLAGLTPSVKIQAGLYIPILWAYLIAQPEVRRVSLLQAVRTTLQFGLGAAIPLCALALYNLALFGSPLRTGYGDSIWELFTTPFSVGFGGQIWGLRRGLIWCMPLSLLIPPALIVLWRRDRGLALFCLAVFMSQLLFYATWFAWDGAGAWGPRF